MESASIREWASRGRYPAGQSSVDGNTAIPGEETRVYHRSPRHAAADHNRFPVPIFPKGPGPIPITDVSTLRHVH